MNQLLYRLILIVMGILCHQTLKCQSSSYKFENVSQQFQKLHIKIISITQDHHGFMWFATNGGLYRYDGIELRSFLHNVLDSTSISSPSVKDVVEDHDGQIWISHNYGINKLDHRTGNFSRFAPFEEGTSTKGLNNINCLYVDRKNQLWAAGNGNLYLIDKEKESFRIIPSKNGGDKRNIIRAIFDGRDDLLWCGTSKGLLKISSDSLYYEHVNPLNDEEYFYSNINDIARAPNDELFLGTSAGLVLFDPVKVSVKAIDMPDGQNNKAIQEILNIGSDTVWMSYFNNGLAYYNLSSNTYQHFLHDNLNINSLHNNEVHSLQNDMFGNIWIGTVAGISKISFHPKVCNFLQNVNGIDQLSNQTLRIHKDRKGVLWFKTSAGIYQRCQEDLFSTLVSIPNVHSGKEVGDWIFEDSEGAIWIPVNGHGIFKKPSNSSLFKSIPVDSKLRDGKVYKIVEDENDKSLLWIGTSKGLCEFDTKNMHFKWHEPKTQIKSISNRTVIFDQLGDDIWMYYTYFNCIGKMDKRTGKFDLIRPPKSQEHMLEGTIRDIAITSDSILWFATSSGLTQYRIKTDSFHIFTEQEGMAENILNAILIDQNEDVWMSGSQFVSKLDRSSGLFFNYDASAHVNNFVSKSKFVDSESRIYFGALNGVFSFRPQEIQSDLKSPQLILTDIKVRNEKYLSNVAPESLTHLVLNSQQKDITFQFAGIQLNQPESVIYRCKLVGYDDNWRNLENLHLANYTNLNPGDYRLLAQAKMLNQDWGTDELSIDVTITPPFTQTNWFRALVALVLALIVYFSYRIWYYNLQLKRDKAFAVKASEYRMEFLSHASHEIRTPMNAILGLSGLVKGTSLNAKQRRYVLAIEQASQNLLHIINELLDHSKIESGEFTFMHTPFDLEIIIEQLKNMFLPLALEKNIQIQYFLDGKAPKKYIGDPLRLTQILTNLVGNSLKFTDSGSVSLHVTADNTIHNITNLKFEIRDTGIGISENKLNSVFDKFSMDQDSSNTLGTGLGLYITKNLIKGQKGDIHIKSQVGKGTVVSFYIPFETSRSSSNKIKQTKNSTRQEMIKVLIVDDAPFNHLVMDGILSDIFPNARILQANNGLEALELFKMNELDIIILDAKMPGLDGLEVCRRIRSSSMPSRNIAILGATAGAMPGQIQACLDSGMNDVITKPINEDQLHQKILQLLQLDQ